MSVFNSMVKLFRDTGRRKGTTARKPARCRLALEERSLLSASSLFQQINLVSDQVPPDGGEPNQALRLTGTPPGLSGVHVAGDGPAGGPRVPWAESGKARDIGRGVGIASGMVAGGLLGAAAQPAVVYVFWLRGADGDL
jgi:hypothetical protein